MQMKGVGVTEINLKTVLGIGGISVRARSRAETIRTRSQATRWQGSLGEMR